jgi:Fe-Mn family superoxide dismutase
MSSSDATSMLDRRSVISAAIAVGTLAASSAALAQAPAAAVAGGPYVPQAKPLPFDPKGIAGLSERLLVSHHDNNYSGAVKRLGAITTQFAGLEPAKTPGFVLNGLKREELIAWNSMILHELYFAGLGASTTMSPGLEQQIRMDFGSHDRWASEFSAMGKALGGGSGWVLLTWSNRDRRLVNQWAADHTMTLAGSTPLLALDMYEHAYAMDYGANAGAYVDAYMKAINWSHASGAFGEAFG